MARVSKQSADEIYQMEIEADERRRNRNSGYAKMKERDAALMELSNGVTMFWHVPKHARAQTDKFEINGNEVEITTYAGINVPEDSFVLGFRNKYGETELHTFDTEEFRKWLRWA